MTITSMIEEPLKINRGIVTSPTLFPYLVEIEDENIIVYAPSKDVARVIAKHVVER